MRVHQGWLFQWSACLRAGMVVMASVLGSQLLWLFGWLVRSLFRCFVRSFVRSLVCRLGLRAAAHAHALHHRNIVNHVETPGTLLHEAWADLDAPPIAVGYWRLPPSERTWLDTLKRMLADEAHHRDINHTLASLPTGAENPFIER